MSNPTTPFSWQMPTATDLVTDLPADFEVFGQAVATSMADLLGGTTGQVLSKTSNTDMAFTWINNDQGDLTAITAGSGISVTSPTGPIPTVALDLTSANIFTAAQTATRFIVTGSTVPTNGIYLPAANTLGLATNSTARLQIDASGNVGIGIAAATAKGVLLQKSLTGSTTSTGFQSSPAFQSDLTGQQIGFMSRPSSANSNFAISEILHFYAWPQTYANITAGGSVAIEYGFYAQSTLTQGLNNYGFYGNIASGTGRWNFYAAGTAANYFAGQTTVGSTSLTLGSGSVAQQFGVVSTAATNIVEVIRGAASQTGDLVQYQTSAGAILAKITVGGNFSAAAFTSINLGKAFVQMDGADNSVNIQTNAAANVGLTVLGIASQTAELTRWRNSSATTLTSITAAGTINFQTGNTSATATAGAVTPPALVVGFITMQVAGTTVKVPYYAN
jgi:hypothetical protein